jgi:hypothetical protein
LFHNLEDNGVGWFDCSFVYDIFLMSIRGFIHWMLLATVTIYSFGLSFSVHFCHLRHQADVAFFASQSLDCADNYCGIPDQPAIGQTERKACCSHAKATDAANATSHSPAAEKHAIQDICNSAGDDETDNLTSGCCTATSSFLHLPNSTTPNPFQFQALYLIAQWIFPCWDWSLVLANVQAAFSPALDFSPPLITDSAALLRLYALLRI